jgi:hypothetical protein
MRYCSMATVRRSVLVLAALLLVGCAGVRDPGIASNEQTRSLLVGRKWHRHLDEKQFFADGTYEANDPTRAEPKHGTWQLHGRSLRLTEDKETTVHTIIAISLTSLEMTFGSGGQRLHYRRSAG